jgi:Spy/CpxP family protein refolding chaperone
MLPMTRPRTWILAAVAASTIAVAAGCGAAVAESDTTAAASQAAARAKGPVAAVKAAVAELGLRADQKAKTDQLFGQVEAKLEPVKDARRGLARDIAAGVRAGKIDQKKTSARVGEIVAAAEAARPTVEDSLNGLHAALDPDQRGDLVAALRDGFHEGRGARGDKLREMAEELQLSDDQKDRIKDAVKGEFMAKRAEHKERFGQMKERMEAAAEAFESDRFDARALELGKNAPEMARVFSQGMVRVAELAIPVLTPVQREKLAVILERKANEME